MPGLVGVASANSSLNECHLDNLQDMLSIISHRGRCVKDDVFEGGCVCGGRVHNNILQKQAQPLNVSGIHVWLDGEFYNQDKLLAETELHEGSDTEILLQLYAQQDDFSFLKMIDGLFAAVIYDEPKQQIYLISDRYGLRYLYWRIHDGVLYWSSELKGFVPIRDYLPKINRAALKQFVVIGFMLEDETWFEDVELLSSGSVLSFDLKSGGFDKQRYWWWDHIEPQVGKIDEDAIIEELGELFRNSVQRRCREETDVGITLSGGLDSRAILAAMPKGEHAIKALTFGRAGCDDVRFAKRAAEIKGVEHHVTDLCVENWLPPRLETVWLNDGFQDIKHAGGAGKYIGELFPINLGGIGGDVVLGGGFLSVERSMDEITQDKKDLVAEVFACEESMLTQFERYVGLRKFDYVFLQNETRRFAYAGSVAARTSFEDRAPFLDNRLVELAYSIPDRYRYDTKLYRKMLLRHFPAYYQHIPWQSTGMPISYSARRERFHQKLKQIRLRLQGKFQRFGIAGHSSKEFASYADWIRLDPAKSFFKKLLCSHNALIQEYIPVDELRSVYERHQAGEDLSTPLCRYLTIELWLQQVFIGKYRHGVELEFM